MKNSNSTSKIIHILEKLPILPFRFGYVEYETREGAENALRLSGHQCKGHSIMIQVTQSEKNRIAAAAAAAVNAGPTRLCVGSLHFNITEDDLMSIFSPFGDIEFVNLHVDPDTGRSKGFAFVQ